MGDARAPFRSRRLLQLAGDARLVEQIRRGNEAAFEVAFERHGSAILAFCRHMLRSHEEAEDAVQHTFAAAYRALRQGDRREIALKPWLFAIARNRCVSMLRGVRETPIEDAGDAATEGLAEEVERRMELRRLVADVRELPDEQRAALLLTELGDLSQAEVGEVLDCEASRVKALVFRARSHLIARREARETPCDQIREQLATLRGGALRRNDLRLHLRDCPGCRAYRDEIRRQRQMLAVALPVMPTAGLKSSVLAAVGLGGSAGGATGLAGALGGATVAKVAVAGALAGGGLVAGDAVVHSDRPTPARPVPAQAAPETDAPAAPAGGLPAGPARPARSDEEGSAREGSAPARRQRGELGTGRDRAGRARGRGPIAAPPGTTPVRRGPPEKAGKPGTAKPQETGKPEKANKPEKPDGPGTKAEKTGKQAMGERAKPSEPKPDSANGTPAPGRAAKPMDKALPPRTVVGRPERPALPAGRPDGPPALD
jgi:RNA polymerase sigma factor (sigma-70 family)